MFMKGMLAVLVLLPAIVFRAAAQPSTPTNVVLFSGDKSAIVHWDPVVTGALGYNVSRSTSSGGPFTQLNSGLVTTLGYCDLAVSDGQTYYYQVTAVGASSLTSPPSATVFTTPNPFPNDDAFMDYVQQANFDYFWYAANPANGLVPDKSAAGSACSIAAVGFGLTAIGIAIDHGWITRDQGSARVLTTLNTFWNGPQGTNASGEIGYNGWFYHFLDMYSATRVGSTELSSIDTALLLGGVLYAKQYFNGTNATETSIQTLASAIFNRVNWAWMAPDIPGTNGVRMGWLPGTGFNGYGDWVGYDEGMLIYLLGIGATSNSLPASCWNYWTSGYKWATYYGYSFVTFPPLFGHEYSHCWVDFRHVGDTYMNIENSTYFENSHRAALAQQAYCIANPGGFAGYSSLIWGLTASDDPYVGYEAHGAPPAENDNGTLAFTAAGGAWAFAPEIALPTMKNFYTGGRTHFWTQYGFIDAFNLSAAWYDNQELGIDQGPIVIMAENYRNQNVWRLFMQNAEIQRGLQQAGFVSLPFEALTAQAEPALNTVTLTWAATAGRTYQVEYSTNLINWFTSPTGEVTATNSTASWTDTGPPGTLWAPLTDMERFYRVFQYGTP